MALSTSPDTQTEVFCFIVIFKSSFLLQTLCVPGLCSGIALTIVYENLSLMYLYRSETLKCREVSSVFELQVWVQGKLAFGNYLMKE